MQTFLIVSGNPAFIDVEIQKITENLQISPVNLIEINPEKSISIAEVRKITHTVMLKPYGGGERAIIIRGIDKATLEASNALLKILEEPPEKNFIILVSDNINKLLPTIISRCQVISDNKKTDEKGTDTGETKNLLRQILTASPGERIILSQKWTNTREEAIELLNNLLVTLEKLLHRPDKEILLSPKDIAALLTKVIAAKNYLERYINFKATLDVLFLGFPKI